ncbi:MULTISPECIES: hypothetical protein [unclassified Oceanispirochaeta]|uniref:hypothetical protein n=1 Tax=unclassified Oceanispirochaeta TaxID=2635722 RepID=UPI000E091B4C|nr:MULTISPECIES: hypothetical protein [unclassified Oceanispirochaeta]MBF9016102.1 hypothetical protein [Oceanispirochaeta sp. M2]NPD72565.1 hypothetical protein [Oceanispirochaeta sp. M1]RDG32020.1 hypothetical protein DV872_10690 [Oceanispirochaeta sp. M1]
MKRLHRGIRIWFPRFLTRFNLYLFYMSLIIFSLYLVGNFQRFSDETLRFLFRGMDIYFYTYIVFSLGNVIFHSLLVKETAGKKTFFYIKSLAYTALIAALYLLINLLSAFFSGA